MDPSEVGRDGTVELLQLPTCLRVVDCENRETKRRSLFTVLVHYDDVSETREPDHPGTVVEDNDVIPFPTQRTGLRNDSGQVRRDGCSPVTLVGCADQNRAVIE